MNQAVVNTAVYSTTHTVLTDSTLMTKLLIEHLRTPMALVYLYETLNICKRVWLAITICTAVRARLARKLADVQPQLDHAAFGFQIGDHGRDCSR